MASDPTELLDALVAHATKHGGSDSEAILEAYAHFKGEDSNAEKMQAAEDEAEAVSEAGKAANRKQVEDAAKAKDK